MKNILFVGGVFNKAGGRPSKIVRRLAYGLYTTINGGTIGDLKDALTRIEEYDALIWMPDIPNDEEKFLPEIKKKAPHILLVSSKRNGHQKYPKYPFEEIVNRALVSRSQLLIEIGDVVIPETTAALFPETAREYRYQFRLVDPLGNVSQFFPSGDEGLEEFRCLLYERIHFLLRMKRVGSVKSAIDPTGKPRIDRQFLGAIQKYADKFHELIHGKEANPRFMGNASFRCTKGGFPSQRTKHAIYVSRRNVDKRCLGSDGFVAVDTTLEHTRTVVTSSDRNNRKKPLTFKENHVMYWGENKPSVDTPVQVELYRLFPNINFMLHAHVYHQGGTLTARYVPCGDLREVDEVVNAVNYPEAKHFIVNLKGHGCIIASECVEDLLDQENSFYARPTPEETL